MRIYYINSWGKRTFVDVDNPEQLIARDIPDLHTGGNKYLICYKDGEELLRIAWFNNKSERDNELKKHQGLISSQVGVVGDLSYWPSNERP